jgi:hypothetical protein
MDNVLPESSSTLTRILYPSSRLVNSNIPLENALFLKFACKEFENLAQPTALLGSGNANNFASNPGDIYSGMWPGIAHITIPAPKQIQAFTKIKYVDDVNAIMGAINDASQVGGVITDLILSRLPPPLSLIGSASQILGKAREITTGRRDLDARDSMFHSAEKRAYNLTFTLVATTQEEARQVAQISNIFHALALPKKANSWGLNVGALYADKAFPPPLWRFGIGLGIGGAVDISWLGQTSFSVLQSVAVNTAAGGSPYMIEDSISGAKPLMTSFSLIFIDYEPVYRTGDTYRVIPRSASNL